MLDGSRAVGHGDGLVGPVLVGSPAEFDVDTRAVTGQAPGGNRGKGQRDVKYTVQLHVEVIGKNFDKY